MNKIFENGKKDQCFADNHEFAMALNYLDANIRHVCITAGYH